MISKAASQLSGRLQSVYARRRPQIWLPTDLLGPVRLAQGPHPGRAFIVNIPRYWDLTEKSDRKGTEVSHARWLGKPR
jgi:hypothetical protein